MRAHQIPHFHVLKSIPADIQRLARLEQTLSHGYMHARNSILGRLGWESSHEFDKWCKKQKRSFHNIQNNSERLRCIVREKPQFTDSVYIFELPLEIVTNLNEFSYLIDRTPYTNLVSARSIGELADILDDKEIEDHEPSNQVSLDIAPSYSSLSAIGSIWVKDVNCYAEKLEHRKPSGTCSAGWAFEYADATNQELYLITTPEEFHKWATVWGGLAIIPNGVTKKLDKNDQVVSSIFADFLTRRRMR
ncbi:hypothetical protein [Vibrio brasiliensis]|uniref:Uncharacterized protein n=1 Tax=Vibrio brasiliensis LMG 20546 TaxID=945543 RepID=E8LYR1_9VIBR|nr:hypothetical protein [Vibrio brasiliensis]EGA64175.1 hypothetical protein VIBR0546_02524 [Vibrio brasiliensis LMG 20546]